MNESNDTARRRRRRRRTLIVLMLAAGLASAGTGAFSLALFTDSAAVGSNAFTTGTIDISTSPTSALLTASAMMPGDTVNGSLVMTNAGTASLRYAMTSASTDTDSKGLRTVITLTIKTLGASCAAFDGTTLYTGVLGPTTAAFGNPAAGGQAGDRTLAAAASETLCFRAELPIGTGNAFQNATTTATFTFDAEQTANNP